MTKIEELFLDIGDKGMSRIVTLFSITCFFVGLDIGLLFVRHLFINHIALIAINDIVAMYAQGMIILFPWYKKGIWIFRKDYLPSGLTGIILRFVFSLNLVELGWLIVLRTRHIHWPSVPVFVSVIVVVASVEALWRAFFQRISRRFDTEEEARKQQRIQTDAHNTERLARALIKVHAPRERTKVYCIPTCPKCASSMHTTGTERKPSVHCDDLYPKEWACNCGFKDFYILPSTVGSASLESRLLLPDDYDPSTFTMTEEQKKRAEEVTEQLNKDPAFRARLKQYERPMREEFFAILKVEIGRALQDADKKETK